MRAKSDSKIQMPFEVSSETLEKFSQTFANAAVRGQSMIENGLKNWESEVERYYEEFSTHSRHALDALGKCKGPLDVLHVEQEWLKARSQAYLDSGMRFAKAFAEIARHVPVQGAEAPSDQPKT